MDQRIRVGIVEDHTIIRVGLRSLLNQAKDFNIVGEKKKSDAERERERRLAVNASGRMTDGTVTEALFLGAEPPDALLLFYRYLVAGVEYSAAQDVSSLREILPRPNYLPGEAITIKYDPHRPPNSIVVCEQWSGLRVSVHGAAPVNANGRQAVKS